MVYLHRAPAMDPSPSPRLNQLSYYVTDAEIIEMVVEYHGLQDRQGVQDGWQKIYEVVTENLSAAHYEVS